VVGLEMLQRRFGAEALVEQAERDLVVVLVGVGLADYHAGPGPDAAGVTPDGDREGGDADADPAGPRAAAEDGEGHARALRLASSSLTNTSCGIALAGSVSRPR